MSTTASLFEDAQAAGSISPDTFQVLNQVDIGAQIQANLGTAADKIMASEVTLVRVKVDDSGSIRMVAGNSEAVRLGHNFMLDALAGSKTRDDLLVCVDYLNGDVLYPFVLLDQAIRMDSSNYNPNGGTPLYDGAAETLASVLAKAQEFENQGVPVRTITLVITDGADVHSRRFTPAQVAIIARDMLKLENHIICAMGIDDAAKECDNCAHDFSKYFAKPDPTKVYAITECPKCKTQVRRTDFYQVFSGIPWKEVQEAKDQGRLEQLEPRTGGMGFLPRWILTPGNSASEIRRAFGIFSRSASNASQGAGTFSQAAMGGFGS